MARVTADLLEVVGIDHVVTVDPHTAQIEGFFHGPVDSLTAMPTLCRALRGRLPLGGVIVARLTRGASRRPAMRGPSVRRSRCCTVKFVTNCSMSMCPCDFVGIVRNQRTIQLGRNKKGVPNTGSATQDNTNPMLDEARKLPVDPDRNDLRQLASLA
jgi:hypothetical protein